MDEKNKKIVIKIADMIYDLDECDGFAFLGCALENYAEKYGRSSESVAAELYAAARMFRLHDEKEAKN